jgi:SAM-dependent methyltransferase
MKCRHCQESVSLRMLDLGFAPPSNAYRTVCDLDGPETTYPLRIFVCGNCRLVQTQDFAEASKLFSSDYAYFSSTSSTWTAHASAYTQMIIKRLSLDQESRVVEIASNDGYLLRNFVAAGIPCLGIEPTASTAAAAREVGVPVLEAFFDQALGQELAAEHGHCDLICANNVLAHVPDINSFVRGMAALIKPNGVITVEFQHLLSMISGAQFDTAYHEHFSYLSLIVVERIFAFAGLVVFDVEDIPTHGGSLRVYAGLAEAGRNIGQAVTLVRDREIGAGLDSDEPYLDFQGRAEKIKDELLSFLIEAKRCGRRVVGYGAAAKGVTLLNFAGVRSDLLSQVFDAAKSKQGKYLPGSHIPVMSPEDMKSDWIDDVLILPWNIADEVKQSLSWLQNDQVRFWIAVPELRQV